MSDIAVILFPAVSLKQAKHIRIWIPPTLYIYIIYKNAFKSSEGHIYIPPSAFQLRHNRTDCSYPHITYILICQLEAWEQWEVLFAGRPHFSRLDRAGFPWDPPLRAHYLWGCGPPRARSTDSNGGVRNPRLVVCRGSIGGPALHACDVRERGYFNFSWQMKTV